MERTTTPDRVALELASVARDASTCTACGLSATRTQTVPGEGSPAAALVFVGEAPGAREDVAGRPFVGAAGRLLDDLLASIGLRREEVFILNTVKCRPPENRSPQRSEINACAPLLSRQLQALQPRVIATLGRHALAVFAPSAKIAEVHGRPYTQTEGGQQGGAVLFPLYHPAAALHNGSLRPTLERDMAALREHLNADAREGAGEATLREVDSVPTRPRPRTQGEAE
ncbi:MAG: uracil-DNA glycosylase [Chloroflexi bacterium]|nr:uracil-DNA glycosylase [Chloroflexota bacterium]